MAIKKYKLTVDSIEVEVCVDTDKITNQIATSINEFFSGAKYRLFRADDDPIKAALLLAFPIIFKALAEGYNEVGATKALQNSEGFPDDGIQVTDVFMPDFDSAEVEEVN